MKQKKSEASTAEGFDRLMRGLIAVPKAELQAEERKYEKAKRARAKRIKKAGKKK